MMFIVIIIVLFGIYYFNKNYECFTEGNEIIELINDYDKLMIEPNENNKNKIKKKIIKTIQDNEIKLTNDYDKYTLTNLLYTDIIKLINNYNKNDFSIVINKIRIIIDKTNEKSNMISDIKKDFNNLNDIYAMNNYVKNKQQIDSLISKIYSSLLQLTNYDTINKAGISLILNKTLKQAYDSNDIMQINSQITTFNEFINKVGYNKEILIKKIY